MRRFWGVVTDCVLLIAIALMLPFVILLLGLPNRWRRQALIGCIRSRGRTGQLLGEWQWVE